MTRKCFFIVLMACVMFCGCASEAKYEELERRVEYLESIHNLNDTASSKFDEGLIEDSASDNEVYRKAQAIDLIYEYDAENGSCTGDYYQLRLWGEKSTFTYYGKDDKKNIYCDFSTDVYYELLDKICSQPLEKYRSKTDSTGKIIYETVPCILSLFLNSSDGSVYLENPENMEEIITMFEKLRDSAKQ